MTDWFSPIQGETGPSGPTGAPGARGAPVSTFFVHMHSEQYPPKSELSLYQIFTS